MRTTRDSTSRPFPALLNRYIGAYFVCHLASYDACALIPFKLFMGFRTLWALELAGAGYPLWLWVASPFACRWGPPATFCKIKEDAWGLHTVDVYDVFGCVQIGFSLSIRSWSNDLDLTENLCDRRCTRVLYKVPSSNIERQHILGISLSILYMHVVFFSFKVFSTSNCNTMWFISMRVIYRTTSDLHWPP